MMANKKRLIDADYVRRKAFADPDSGEAIVYLQDVDEAPTVDAVVLPCKIGDKVYRIDKGNYLSDWGKFVQELTVTEISWKKEKYGEKDLGFAIIADGIRYKFTSIGKSVFLTRKEAEEKLNEERRTDG